MPRAFTVASMVYLFMGFPVQADVLSGEREIALLTEAGEKIVIGTVHFEPAGEQVTYSIRWEEGPYNDHFLSMRPFRCLEGPTKHWCYIDYPYPIQRVVSPDNLTDLEYDLLFLHKGATEYGINMWNGVYYRLTYEDDRLTGTIHEMDMDVLSAPPASGNLRPINASDLHETDPEEHWLPRVVIE